MKPKKIKLFWTLGLTATLVASATVALSILWPRLFPSLYVSDLYRRYENNEYIRATEIHNFRVNDTLAVETLLLEASTDSAWCALLLDFGMPKEMIEDYLSDKKSFEGTGTNIITLFTIDKNNPQKSLPREEPDSRVVSVSFAKKSLCVFMTEDKTIKETISDGEIHKINNKNNQK